MSDRNAKLFLTDILESIKNIIEYTEDISIEKFADNKMLKDAVIRNFEIIGEAAKNLPQKIKSQHPDIPWKEMAGMRDKMIHEYFGIDVDIVWQTIRSLPQLQSLLVNVRLD